MSAAFAVLASESWRDDGANEAVLNSSPTADGPCRHGSSPNPWTAHLRFTAPIFGGQRIHFGRLNIYPIHGMIRLRIGRLELPRHLQRVIRIMLVAEGA